MAENIILCGYLGICSCFDCRKRQIPIWLLRLGVGAGMAYALFCWRPEGPDGRPFLREPRRGR